MKLTNSSWRILFLVVGALVFTSGCYKAETKITVNNDNSADVVSLIGIDPVQFGSDQPQNNGAGPAGRVNTCKNNNLDTFLPNVPGNASSSSFDDGLYCGTITTYSISSRNDLNSSLRSSLSSDRTPAELNNFTFLKLSNDKWTFDLNLGGKELSEIVKPKNLEGELSNAIVKSLDFSYVISLPGAVDSHNADSVKSSKTHTTFTWNLPNAGSLKNLKASTKPAKVKVVPVDDDKEDEEKEKEKEKEDKDKDDESELKDEESDDEEVVLDEDSNQSLSGVVTGESKFVKSSDGSVVINSENTNKSTILPWLLSLVGLVVCAMGFLLYKILKLKKSPKPKVLNLDPPTLQLKKTTPEASV